MDQLHYDKCDRCNTRYWEHEGQRDLIEVWFPDRELIFLCKLCIRTMYAKEREAHARR